MIMPARLRPVFVAALPREVAGLVSGWRRANQLLTRGIQLYWNDQAVVACAGMGSSRVALAVEAALDLGPASELVSIGWAGACIHRLAVGDLLSPDVVVDARTGERFFPDKNRGQTEGMEILVTVGRPAGTAEKERIALSYYASAVDMEAATVARLARSRDLPFQAIKAISDGAQTDLPDLSEFTTVNGKIREGALGLHIALRPALWKATAVMARGSKLAASRLHAAVNDHILHHRNQTQ